MAGAAEKLIMSSPPDITDVERLRQFRKQRLAIAFRVFAGYGFNTGPGGHAAVRDPENPDWFWTNPFGRAFECLTASDMVLVDDHGNLVEGEGIVNAAAVAIHVGIHAARPDVIASVHLHGTPGVAWSTMGRKLDPLSQDACAYFDDHEVYAEFDGPALEPSDGERMAKVLGSKKALILQNHGLLTASETIDAAAFFMVRMQLSCQVQLLAEAAGEPQPLPDDIARATWEVNGTPKAGWFGFQSLVERVVAQEPDVLR